jgi:2-furoyl-CoA dehydrogenase large subunit
VAEGPFRYIGARRRVKEDRRFLAGAGHFVADISLPGMLHVAIVASPHPHARLLRIDSTKAAAMAGVRAVVTGEDIVRATDPLMSGLDLPKVLRYPLAAGRVRYPGEWVAAVVAESRAVAEDAAELVDVEYDPLPHVIDPEAALEPGAPLVHPEHGSNLLYRRKFVWGPIDADFAAAAHRIAYRARWHRSATVPIETFGVLARWEPGTRLLDVWASIQMPKYADQLARALRLPGNAVRVHFDVDVGGSYGGKRGLKHSVLVGHLARRLGAPVRFIEDRLENLRGGDAHGPDRIFDVEMAFAADGTVRAMRMRALDDVGAYAGRALPARQADRRDRRALPHQERRLRADLRHHEQDAGRGGARLRPVADQFCHRDRHGFDRARARHRPDRIAPPQSHPAGGISLRDSEWQHI